MCNRCQDRGYYGGKLNGPYAGPWKWCSCAAALEAQHANPGLVDQANAAWEKCRKLDGKHKAMAAQIDGYGGEF